ncbi:MAG: helix-turn-helix domain-containing protein [Verrucomicrobiae bacterium]|nr:helix-turn-helix domain-containing protein [Verrucomicrobiae bacterium]
MKTLMEDKDGNTLENRQQKTKETKNCGNGFAGSSGSSQDIESTALQGRDCRGAGGNLSVASHSPAGASSSANGSGKRGADSTQPALSREPMVNQQTKTLRFRMTTQPMLNSPMLWDLIRMNQYLRDCRDSGTLKNHAMCVALLNSLATMAYRNRNGTFNASLSELSEGSGLSVNSVQRALKELEKTGVVRVVSNYRRRKPNLYVLMKVENISCEDVAESPPVPNCEQPVNNSGNNGAAGQRLYPAGHNTYASQGIDNIATGDSLCPDGSTNKKREIRAFLSNLEERVKRLENKKSSFPPSPEGGTSKAHAPNTQSAGGSSGLSKDKQGGESGSSPAKNGSSDANTATDKCDKRTLMVIASQLKERIKEFEYSMDRLKRDYGFASDEDMEKYNEYRKKKRAVIERLNQIYDQAGLPELKR